MDAYDIFKKLTKGLTFKHKVLGVKNNVQNTIPLLKESDIKKEPKDEKEEISDEDFENDFSDSDNSVKEENDNDMNKKSDNESDDEMEIIKGVSAKKGKEKKKKSRLSPEELQKKLELEEQNRFRNEHGIRAVGRHIPPALHEFSDLRIKYNVPQGLVDTVMECGYTEPTPIQRQALPCLLEGRQIVACAPTGSGKTAAFLLPLFHLLGTPQGGPRALILCPTRELAHQIYREALRLSAFTQLRCTVIKSVKESKVKEREATIRKSDIVISTPNRLCYLLNQDNVGISLDKVQWLIIDEADKMFEGSTEEVDTFRQQLDVIMANLPARLSVKDQAKDKSAKDQTKPVTRLAMFSATHTPAIAKWARHNMRGLINITVGHRNAASSLVEQELLFCGNESGKLVAFRQLVQKGLKPPVLVFVQSKERAKELFKELIYDGINVDVIHADRTQAQRDNVVRSFRVGRIWVLICTELMGRGMDFRGVNLVVNYDFPPSAIAYIHRIGRAGRAGQKGKAITFFTQDDVVNLRSIASVMKRSGCEVPEYMLRLKQDANKRKRLLQRAPKRDKISTRLEKPEKRKLDDKNEKETTKDTDKVKNGKHKKQRKTDNAKPSPEKKTFKPKENKKTKKLNKKMAKKKQKKKLSKPTK
ncbi:probable ATP-dependent RNA helicase DDX52 isoform X2 [Aricia agestis]|uniref:probable ATP-dependent RNA helicase DDX52 isoform X2 n=1 Tax=Aricia agestis TaxID=91739 RepID=UPI001C20AB67|nr:probable ATP-dependent RNA helicase DDX52 isoform X2 [Aricia agestis]